MKVDVRQISRVGRSGETVGTEDSSAQDVTVRSIHALELLKSRLLRDQVNSVQNPELRQRFQRAADDSASLAWATSFPLLALPELLAEKTRETFRQFKRQQAIRAQGRRHDAQIELAA